MISFRNKGRAKETKLSIGDIAREDFWRVGADMEVQVM
jgi:hypothetical protein